MGVKAIGSIIIGAIGLLLSTCGLVFVGHSLTGNGGGGGVLPIAVPSVIVGGLLLWGAVALWRSWRRSRKAAAAGPQ